MAVTDERIVESPRVQPRIVVSDEYSLQLEGSVAVQHPSYVQMINGSVYVTSFSLAGNGFVAKLGDCGSGGAQSCRYELQKLKHSFMWPNEIGELRPDAKNNPNPNSDPNNPTLNLAPSPLIVADGFLMPGQCNGGIYSVEGAFTDTEVVRQLTSVRPGWFYHRTSPVSFPTSGTTSGTKTVTGLLTARARKPLFGTGRGELVWLQPCADTNAPWTEHVLLDGPDVMFEVVDLDPRDDTIEVMAAEFFGRRLTLLSLRYVGGPDPVEVVLSHTIDDTIGRTYDVCATSLAWETDRSSTHLLVTSHDCRYDVNGALRMGLDVCAGNYPRVRVGVSGAEDTNTQFGDSDKNEATGGRLFSYLIPENWRSETATWHRQTIAEGFKVRGWGGIISPGAPGFVYTVDQQQRPPVIVLAGDCAGSAYILTPYSDGKEVGSEANYKLAFEIECGATVGSVSAFEEPETGDIRLFVPSYEFDIVHVYRLRCEKYSQTTNLSER